MLTPEKLKENLLTCSEELFTAACAAVDERRGDLRQVFASRHERALASLSDSDLAALYKRDPAIALRMEEKFGSQRDVEQVAGLVVNITPYTVEDTLLLDIIKRCDMARFKEMMKAGRERERALRGSVEYEKFLRDRRRAKVMAQIREMDKEEPLTRPEVGGWVIPLTKDTNGSNG